MISFDINNLKGAKIKYGKEGLTQPIKPEVLKTQADSDKYGKKDGKVTPLEIQNRFKDLSKKNHEVTVTFKDGSEYVFKNGQLKKTISKKKIGQPHETTKGGSLLSEEKGKEIEEINRSIDEKIKSMGGKDKPIEDKDKPIEGPKLKPMAKDPVIAAHLLKFYLKNLPGMLWKKSSLVKYLQKQTKYDCKELVDKLFPDKKDNEIIDLKKLNKMTPKEIEGLVYKITGYQRKETSAGAASKESTETIKEEDVSDKGLLWHAVNGFKLFGKAIIGLFAPKEAPAQTDTGKKNRGLWFDKNWAARTKEYVESQKR